jgi:hypothetical protein
LSELINEAAKAAGGVAEAVGCLVGGEPLDKIRSQGLVLAMRGVGGFEKVMGECQFFC